MIVPTAFAARALVEASRDLDNEDYLRFARTACDFILNDLNRSEEASDEVCFSYSPFDKTRVFNASLLAAEVLATVGARTKEESLCDMATRAARYVLRRQMADGSWAYGADSYQKWSDSFHTAFILVSLSRIVESSESARDELEPAILRGYELWIERFFLANGWPKYFPDRLYPADVHSAAAAIIAGSHRRVGPRGKGLAPGVAGLRAAGLAVVGLSRERALVGEAFEVAPGRHP